MRVLIDTGATTTFINKRMLENIRPHPRFTKSSHSFVLADGKAPFHVLGVLKLRITFANLTTTIHAHVAENLCTDVILGMDYISTYNLNFDLRKHLVSIEYNNHQYFMNIDQQIKPRFIPVTLSIPLHLPPPQVQSFRSGFGINFLNLFKIRSSHQLFSIHSRTCQPNGPPVS
jgi:predicted aspartyl protease